MSTIKIVIIVGVCLLLGGCVPVSGIKSGFALIFAMAAAVGAWMGFVRDTHEHAVCQKARELNEALTEHEYQYHGSFPKGMVVKLQPPTKVSAPTRMKKGIAAARLNKGM